MMLDRDRAKRLVERTVDRVGECEEGEPRLGEVRGQKLQPVVKGRYLIGDEESRNRRRSAVAAAHGEHGLQAAKRHAAQTGEEREQRRVFREKEDLRSRILIEG